MSKTTRNLVIGLVVCTVAVSLNVAALMTGQLWLSAIGNTLSAVYFWTC